MSEPAKLTLPPGPPLPGMVQAALLLRYWPRLVAAYQRRYGNMFTMQVASMGTLVYLADPADIKTVFAGDPADLGHGADNYNVGF